MKVPQQKVIGNVAQTEVCANFERIKWGPLSNDRHDLGTDIFVQARDEQGVSRGIFIGVQVKSGQEAFADPVRDDGLEIVGWGYYEPDVEHFDEWVTHGLPHLIVLHDLSSRVSYWQHVTAERVKSTERGCKIEVPKRQTISDENLDALLEAAASQKAALHLEGSAWNAGASAAPPARRLRWAVLAPRLVAPHPNRGFSTSIGPEEALALLFQGRVSDLETFAERNADIPSPSILVSHRDWRWRIVLAAFQWLVVGNPDLLADCVKTAPRRHQRTIATVLSSCALIDAERHDDALYLLTALEESFSGVDLGWLLVQRSRIRAEVGDVEGARKDAVASQRALLGDKDDPTASVIAAASAWMLFSTASLEEKAVGEVLNTSDTLISWWRAQTVSSALGQLADNSFRDWCDESSVQTMSGDPLHNGLLAGTLSAHVAGEIGVWRAIGSLFARHTIVAGHRDDDRGRIADGLHDLRRSGDDRSLGSALRRLWTIGPIDPIRDACGRLATRSWVHTCAKANFEMWRRGGDCLEESTADTAMELCLDAFMERDHWLFTRTRPWFTGYLSVLQAIGGLLPASGTLSHRRTIRAVVALGPMTDGLVVSEVERLLPLVRQDAVTRDDRRMLLECALVQPSRSVGAAILGLLTRVGDREAREELLRRAEDADLSALANIGDVRILDEAAAENALLRIVASIESISEKAKRGHYSGGGLDVGRAGVLLNVWFPKISLWDPVLTLLNDPRVAADDKRGACEVLAGLANRLPYEVKQDISNCIPVLAESKASLLGFDGPLGGLVARLEVALGIPSDPELMSRIARLSTGGPRERMHLATLLTHVEDRSLFGCLAGLVGDSDVDVRASAAFAVSRILARSQQADPMLSALFSQSAADPGALVPLRPLQGLKALDSQVPSSLMDDIALLTGHLSARVRQQAHGLLSTS